jgi:hypothetical protein
VTNEDECLGPGDQTQQLGTGTLDVNVNTEVKRQSFGRLLNGPCMAHCLSYAQRGLTLKVMYAVLFYTIHSKIKIISLGSLQRLLLQMVRKCVLAEVLTKAYRFLTMAAIFARTPHCHNHSTQHNTFRKHVFYYVECLYYNGEMFLCVITD